MGVGHDMRSGSFFMVAGLLSLSLASGCNTTDPNKGGLFGGIGGLTSGSYQKGVDQRKKTLEDEKDTQISLQREADRTDQQNQALEAEIAKNQAQLDALNQDIAALQSKIRSAKTKQGADQAKLDALQAELNDIDAKTEAQSLNIDEVEKQAKLAELQRRKEQLEEALATLLE